MANKTPNHNLNLYEQGDENWTHTPDMEVIEERLIVRDLEENRDDYTPYEDALFFARDSETWHVGDGTSWTRLGAIGETNKSTETDGIASKCDHVGPFHQGDYHSEEGARWGIAFAAEDNLTIQSIVLDVNLESANLDTCTVELWQVENRTNYVIETPSEPLDTATSGLLNDGPNRISLSPFTIPDNDGYEEYYLTVTPEADANGNELEFRRIDAWDGWNDWTLADHGIDFLQGGRMDNATANDWSDNYYYFFDLQIGNAYTQITSPWSHDVDEIYMRPRDPAEEFDNVSPRALWIDTSE